MLPFIVFKSKEDHQRALNIWANIVRENDSAPLEHRVRGTIIKLDSKGADSYQGVYILSHIFLKIFTDNSVQYEILDTAKISAHLSDAGREELKHVLKYRNNELIQPQN